MSPVENTVQEVRGRTIMLIRHYEQGRLTLHDLAQELAFLAPLYQHALGGHDDYYQALLSAASDCDRTGEGSQALEQALTTFRRAAAAAE
jgi:hypothetical protein